MNRCVIIGAGEIKDIGFIKSLINDSDTVVCADAGYLVAEKIGLNIDFIVGDFDSSNKPDYPNVYTLPVEKDVTDTFFCADMMIKRGYGDFLLLGMTGGRIDHTLANIMTLFYLCENGCKAQIVDETNKMFLIKENVFSMPYSGYENVSFFALFGAVKDLEIKNAKYGLSRYDLEVNDPLCVSNSFVDKKDILIKKSSGILLAIESH